MPDTPYYGIDVSFYQGSIDFNAVSDAGIQVVYIRAGASPSRTDSRFNVNYQGARDAGLHIGFYFYLTARTTAEAAGQARYFYQLIQGKSFDCRPAMDYESFPGLTNQQINANAAAFLETLQSLLGDAPALYSNAYRVRTLWSSSLSAYPLWVAHYGTGSESPQVLGPWRTWGGFQYSNSGSVPGIQGAVDLDRFQANIFLTKDPSVPRPSYYTVQPGDTLWEIAQAHNTTVQVLASLNGLTDPSLIYPGQQLLLPGSNEENIFFYQVQAGDTLSGIALRFGTTLETLAELNQITDPNLIYTGEILRIPKV